MSEIEIQQDWEIDEDGEIGGPMHTYWCYGHGHKRSDFIRFVFELCVGQGVVPRFDSMDHPVVEMWQVERPTGDGITYERHAIEPTNLRRHVEAKPITLLDLDYLRHGGRSCSVVDCRNPWASTAPHPLIVEGDRPRVSLKVPLCREHKDAYPEPYYRMVVVPVGATVLLPAIPISTDSSTKETNRDHD
jgi:hypothetical protein